MSLPTSLVVALATTPTFAMAGPCASGFALIVLYAAFTAAVLYAVCECLCGE